MHILTIEQSIKVTEEAIHRVFHKHLDWPKEPTAIFEETFGSFITPERIAALAIIGRLSQHFTFVPRETPTTSHKTKSQSSAH